MRSSWILLALAMAASVSAQPAPRRLALVGGMLLDGLARAVRLTKDDDSSRDPAEIVLENNADPDRNQPIVTV